MRRRLIYIASGFENRHWLRDVVSQLRLNDIHQTYEWMQHEPSDEVAPHDFMVCGMSDHAGVRAAVDGVVVVLPGAEGTHCELGMALELSRPVLLLTPATHARRVPFYLNPLVTRRVYDTRTHERMWSVTREVCDWFGMMPQREVAP